MQYNLSNTNKTFDSNLYPCLDLSPTEQHCHNPKAKSKQKYLGLYCGAHTKAHYQHMQI